MKSKLTNKTLSFLLAVCLALSLQPLLATKAMAANDRCVKLKKDVESLFDLATTKDGKGKYKSRIKGEFHGRTYTTNVAVNHIQGFTCYYLDNALISQKIGFISYNTSSSYGDFMVLHNDTHHKFSVTEMGDKDGKFNHPGGLQLIGDYAVAPIESDKNSYVYAFNLSQISKERPGPGYFPLRFGDDEHIRRSGKAGVVGICDYTARIVSDDKTVEEKSYYLLATYDEEKTITFYTSEITLEKKTLEDAVFEEKTHRILTTDRDEFHGMSFIVEEGETSGDVKMSDKVFLVGFCSKYKDPGTYEDFVGLFEVDVNKNFAVKTIVSPSNRHMETTGGGIPGVHFRWGASALARQWEINEKTVSTLELYVSERHCSGSHMTYNIFSSGFVREGDHDPATPDKSSGGCNAGVGFAALGLALWGLRRIKSCLVE